MADIIVFRENTGEWQKQFHSTSGMVGDDVSKRAQRLRILAAHQAGHHTGRLASTMRAYVSPGSDGPTALVGSDDRIALIHHNGTRPHVELADRGRMLRFSVRGKIVYARKVFNPGTRPNRYLTDNLRRVVID